MKKLLALAMALTLCLGLAACGGDTADAGTDTTDDTAQTGETVTLRVGATPAPHEEILEQVVDNLAEQGITLEIVPYTDYNTPNTAVEEGEDDANYFQHITYMENFNAEHGTHLVSAGAIHYEPMGIYAGKSTSLDEIPDGAVIAVPNDATNEGRALLLLQDLGIITLSEDAGLEATKNDIVDNPHNIDLQEMEAAIATVVGQCVAAVAALTLNLKKNPEIHIRPSHIRWHGATAKNIYRIGLPSIVMQCIGSVMVFGVNRILISFTTTATAVFGAYFKLQSFIFMPVFGLNNGMVPIIAYNYGARKPDRVKRTIKLAVLSAMAIMAVGFAVFQLAPGVLLSFFDASENMLAIGSPALRIISFSFILAGFCIIAGSVCQAIGNPFYSLIVSVCRQLVVLLPVAWLLSKTGNLTLVWLAFPIAELMSLTLSIIFLRKTLRMAEAAMASGKSAE